MRRFLVWCVLIVSVVAPVFLATQSPQLAWRDPIYIIAGFSGVLAMAVLFMQPLLVGAYLPGVAPRRERWLHRVFGTILVGAVVIHVVALWITSPPDVVDALLFVSATSFSVWGVVAMWAVFGAALLAVLRRQIPLRVWRIAHTVLAVITVVGSVVHAMLIEGTMEPVSKFVLCALALVATGKVVSDLRGWTKRWPIS